MCPLDETAIEAVQRDVYGGVKRCGAAKIPYRSASLRLNQNISAYTNGTFQYQCAVERAFSAISAVARQGRIADGCWYRPVRLSRFGDLWKFVYRRGATEFAHWGVFEERMKPFNTMRRPRALNARSKLMKDHLSSLLQNGSVYSL